MEAKDRDRFDRALTAPMPGRPRQVDTAEVARETDSLRSMASWAAGVERG